MEGQAPSSRYSILILPIQKLASAILCLKLKLKLLFLSLNLVMGIIRFSFSLMLGTAIGIYVAQNYDVPSIRELAHSYIMNAKHIEETYRKPQKSGDSKGNSQ